ncbi:MAG: hypothetical protein NZ534_08035, partial [Bacteroidia bacterium]|nr:hypothetical protein [Bacteroidia bacterium]
MIVRKGDTVKIVDFKVSFNQKLSEKSAIKARRQLSIYKALLMDMAAYLGLTKNDIQFGEIKALNYVLKFVNREKDRGLDALVSGSKINLTEFSHWVPDYQDLVSPDGLTFINEIDPMVPFFHSMAFDLDEEFAGRFIPNVPKVAAKLSKEELTTQKNLILAALEVNIVLLERVLNSLTKEGQFEHAGMYAALNLRRVKLNSLKAKLEGISGDEQLQAFFDSKEGSQFVKDFNTLLAMQAEEAMEFFRQKGIVFPDGTIAKGYDYTKLQNEDWTQIHMWFELASAFEKVASFIRLSGDPRDPLSLVNNLAGKFASVKDVCVHAATTVAAQEASSDGFERPDVYSGGEVGQTQLRNLIYTERSNFDRIAANFTSSLFAQNNIESLILRLINEADAVANSHNAAVFKRIDDLAVKIKGDYDAFYQVDKDGNKTGLMVVPETFEFYDLAHRMVHEPGDDTKEFANNDVIFLVGDLIKLKKVVHPQKGEVYIVVVDNAPVKSFDELMNHPKTKEVMEKLISKGLYGEKELKKKLMSAFVKAQSFV